jgi:hypothetical protein
MIDEPTALGIACSVLIASQTLAAFHICKALKDKGLLTGEEASAAMVATAEGIRSAGDKSDKIHGTFAEGCAGDYERIAAALLGLKLV